MLQVCSRQPPLLTTVRPRAAAPLPRERRPARTVSRFCMSGQKGGTAVSRASPVLGRFREIHTSWLRIGMPDFLLPDFADKPGLCRTAPARRAHEWHARFPETRSSVGTDGHPPRTIRTRCAELATRRNSATKASRKLEFLCLEIRTSEIVARPCAWGTSCTRPDASRNLSMPSFWVAPCASPGAELHSQKARRPWWRLRTLSIHGLHRRSPKSHVAIVRRTRLQAFRFLLTSQETGRAELSQRRLLSADRIDPVTIPYAESAGIRTVAVRFTRPNERLLQLADSKWHDLESKGCRCDCDRGKSRMPGSQNGQ